MGAGVGAFLAIEEEQIRRNAIHRLQITKMFLRDVSDPFSLPPEYFRKHYRLTQHLALELINILRPQIEGQRNSAIPVHLQVLSVLRFLSEGSFQKGTASDFNHPVSQATMSQCIERVVNALVNIADQMIIFPKSQEERVRIKNSFLRYNRIAGVIGLIDYFKVSFWKPVENEEAFFSYNAGTCMNVQVVADADYIIRSLRICPGSSTDQFIWRHSQIKAVMLNLRANEDIVREEGYYYLLGDNGYSPSPVLLTPILDAAENSPEARYTAEHVSTRCKIEQCFGILTNVWLAISRSRKLHYQPQKVARIIVASAVLHNFRKINGMPDLLQPFHEENVCKVYRDEGYVEGINERNRLINIYYG